MDEKESGESIKDNHGTMEQQVGEVPQVKEHKMGLVSCSSYVIGNIIGSGIFITANSVATIAGSIGLTLLMWFSCAAISFLGAIVYIELATSIPDPGADYAYAMKVGWEGLAFSFMLVSVCITFPASAAVQSITFGQYLTKFFGLDSGNDDYTVIAFAMGLLALIMFLNFFSLDKIAGPFQNIVSVCKLLSIGAIIVIGLYFLIFKGKTENFVNIFDGSDWDVTHMVMGIYGGLWSYAGWDILNYGTPEIKNSRSTMPLSLFFGLTVVAVAYLLINVSFFTVMTFDEVVNSTAIGDDFARYTFGSDSFLAKIIPGMIAILVMGTLNSNLFCGSRIMHAAAIKGQLPAFISGVNPSSASPRPAVLLQALLAAIMCLVPTDFLVNAVTFVMWAQKAVTAGALIYIRHKHVEVESEAIRVPLILTYLLFFVSLGLVVIPFVDQFLITLVGCGVILLGLIIYIVILKTNVWERCGICNVYDKISDFVCSITSKVLCVEIEPRVTSTPEERVELNSNSVEKSAISSP